MQQKKLTLSWHDVDVTLRLRASLLFVIFFFRYVDINAILFVMFSFVTLILIPLCPLM